MKKIILTLDETEVFVFHKFFCTEIPKLRETHFTDKMKGELFKEMVEKLHSRTLFPKSKNRISFSAAQLYAFLSHYIDPQNYSALEFSVICRILERIRVHGC